MALIDHKTLGQLSLHQTLAGTQSLSGYSIFNRGVDNKIGVITGGSGNFGDNNWTYTVPAGMKAMRVARQFWNSSGSTATVNTTVTRVSGPFIGSYLSISNSVNNNSGFGSSWPMGNNIVTPGPLGPGDSFTINSTQNLYGMIGFVLFDESCPFTYAALVGVSAGWNLLYQCPEGVTGHLIDFASGGGSGAPTSGISDSVSIFNASGGTIQSYLSLVPNPGTTPVDATSQISPLVTTAFAGAGTSGGHYIGDIIFTPGDALYVWSNTTSANIVMQACVAQM